MDVERIKICSTSKYYVPCSKKFKDTIVSSQKEQSCIYDVGQHLILLTIKQYEGLKHLVLFSGI